MASSFNEALESGSAASDRAEKMALYAFLVGRWEMDGIVYREGGAKYEARGEIHAAWALEGRAIQDVWIFPGVFYGTTLRVFDPGIDAWHILWSDPLKQYYTRQIGRARGADIVQEGTGDQGVPLRWRFTEIKPASFHWLGERSAGDGAWTLEAEFFARRA